MANEPNLRVFVDLERVRANTVAAGKLTGVPVLAVVKADAYGLGAQRVSEAIADLVEGFCVFSLQEAINANLHQRTGKRVLALGPPGTASAEKFRAAGVTPAISTVEQAALLRGAQPILCVDTGMQRLACPAENVDAVLRAGECREAFTHAISVEQAIALEKICGGRGLKLHAASTSLLHEPTAALDAVRPGLALYRNAPRVVTRLIETHDSTSPAGYSGFVAPRHGVILVGYSHGLRPGFCTINGSRRRVIEVGMQTAFVEIGPQDRIGDEVALLDEVVDEQLLADTWQVTPHQVLFQLCANVPKEYVSRQA